MTKNDSAPIRAAAAKKLAHDPEPDAGEALVNASGDKDWRVRAGALDAIALREDASLISKIASAMDDKNDVVRFTAELALRAWPACRNKPAARVPPNPNVFFEAKESSISRRGRLGKNRDFDARRKTLGAINALGGLLVVGLLRLKNIGNEFLRVAVNDGKPGALHLHHDAVAFLEDVVCGV